MDKAKRKACKIKELRRQGLDYRQRGERISKLKVVRFGKSRIIMNKDANVVIGRPESKTWWIRLRDWVKRVYEAYKRRKEGGYTL